MKITAYASSTESCHQPSNQTFIMNKTNMKNNSNMKKFLSLMLGIAAMFASYSQNEEPPTENGNAKQVTFSLTADNGAQTRTTTISTLRYVMAIYDESSQTDPIHHGVYSSGDFAVRLDPGKIYRFVL